MIATTVNIMTTTAIACQIAIGGYRLADTLMAVFGPKEGRV